MTQKLDNLSIDLKFLISFTHKIECEIKHSNLKLEDIENYIPITHVVGLSVMVKNLGRTTGDSKLDELLKYRRNKLVHSRSVSEFITTYSSIIVYIKENYNNSDLFDTKTYQILTDEIIYKKNLYEHIIYNDFVEIYTEL